MNLLDMDDCCLHVVADVLCATNSRPLSSCLTQQLAQEFRRAFKAANFTLTDLDNEIFDPRYSHGNIDATLVTKTAP